jgi:glutamine amidotransferase PdxT
VFISAARAERIGEDAKVLAAEPRTGKVVAVRQGPALATGFHPSSITCGSAEISAI